MATIERSTTKGKNKTREELKKQITEETETLFINKGVKNVTMNEVANNIGISKRTLYEIFPDKESLLSECVLWRWEKEEEYIKKINEENDNALQVIFMIFIRRVERLHKTNKAFFEDIKKYRSISKMLEKWHKDYLETAISFMQSGVKQGFFRKDINYEVTLILLKAQFDLMQDNELCSRYSAIEIYEAITFNYLRGITTDKGREIVDNFIKEYKRKTNKI